MAERQTADEPRDVMQDAWCCLTCWAKFKFGQTRMRNGALRCPKCGSSNIGAADGRVYEEDADGR